MSLRLFIRRSCVSGSSLPCICMQVMAMSIQIFQSTPTTMRCCKMRTTQSIGSWLWHALWTAWSQVSMALVLLSWNTSPKQSWGISAVTKIALIQKVASIKASWCRTPISAWPTRQVLAWWDTSRSSCSRVILVLLQIALKIACVAASASQYAQRMYHVRTYCIAHVTRSWRHHYWSRPSYMKSKLVAVYRFVIGKCLMTLLRTALFAISAWHLAQSKLTLVMWPWICVTYCARWVSNALTLARLHRCSF